MRIPLHRPSAPPLLQAGLRVPLATPPEGLVHGIHLVRPVELNMQDVLLGGSHPEGLVAVVWGFAGGRRGLPLLSRRAQGPRAGAEGSCQSWGDRASKRLGWGTQAPWSPRRSHIPRLGLYETDPGGSPRPRSVCIARQIPTGQEMTHVASAGRETRERSPSPPPLEMSCRSQPAGGSQGAGTDGSHVERGHGRRAGPAMQCSSAIFTKGNQK